MTPDPLLYAEILSLYQHCWIWLCLSAVMGAILGTLWMRATDRVSVGWIVTVIIQLTGFALVLVRVKLTM